MLPRMLPDYDTAAELPGGNIDYGIYEEYGLIYDKNSKCYTYKGNVVRFLMTQWAAQVYQFLYGNSGY